MKKLTSLLLALMMVLSVLSTFVVFTSAAGNDLLKTYDKAADGDLLYQAKFGQKDGAFKSEVFAIGKKGDNENTAIFDTKISDDGYSIEFTYVPDKKDNGDNNPRRLYYGGIVEGLKHGNGEKYTIEYKVHSTNTSKTTNYGVHYNFPNAFATDDLLKRDEYNALLGYYGTPVKRQTLCIGGSKYTGKYISSDQDYITEYTFDPDAEGYDTIAIEVEDNAFRVFINGTFFDEGYVYDEQEALASNIGISFYLYNQQTYDGDTIKAKDVKIYKGHTMSPSAVKPDYYKPITSNPNSTNKLVKEYDAATDGDLLYKVKMDAEDGVFVPKVHRDQLECTTFEVTENSVEFLNVGADSGFWWGDTIDGLKVTADTKYTMTLKVQSKTAGKNGGFGFVTTKGQMMGKCFNYYGFFNKIEGANNEAKTVIERYTGKIPGQVNNTKDYVTIYPIQDEELFTDVAVEVNGFVFTVYYRSNVYGIEDVDPYWAIYEVYDMSEDLKYYGIADMAFMTYTHNTTTNWIAKDVEIYKGLTINSDGTPGGTSSEETTTEEVTTKENENEETTKPNGSATTTTAAPTTPAEKKGCGSMITGGLVVMAIVSLGAVAVSKKRD